MFCSSVIRDRHVALIFAALFLCASATAQTSAPSDEALLAIDAGRLLAMLGQVSVLLKTPDLDEPAGESPADELDIVVSRYEGLRKLACQRNVLAGSECTNTYTPDLRPFPVASSILRGELDDAEAHIRPFWEAICRKLDNPAQPVCQME